MSEGLKPLSILSFEFLLDTREVGLFEGGVKKMENCVNLSPNLNRL